MNPVFSESFADGGVVGLWCVGGSVSTCGNKSAVPRISRPCLPSGMGFAENGLHKSAIGQIRAVCPFCLLQGGVKVVGFWHPSLRNRLHTCSACRLQGALRAEPSVRFGFFEVNGSKQEINGWQYGGIAMTFSSGVAKSRPIAKNLAPTSDSLDNSTLSRSGGALAKHLINRGVFRDGATTPEQRGQNGPFSLLCHGRRRRY